MRKKGQESTIISIVIPIIIFIIIIVFLFFLLKAASYSGRLPAKFGYALAGSISLIVNKPAQIAQSIGEDGLIALAGFAAAAFIIGGADALGGEEDIVPAEEEETIGNTKDLTQDFSQLESTVGNPGDEEGSLSTFLKGGASAVGKLIGNPLYQNSLLFFGGLFLIGDITNTIASEIQTPILNYLAPEGVYFIDFNSLSSSDLNQMYQNLNQSFVKPIEQYCQNPQSPECENIFLTYLIALDLYYTWGETLGQSVAIAGSHDEYFIGYINYNSGNYNVTQEGVLCMLGMMDFFGQSPLDQMYNMNLQELLSDINYDGDLECQIAKQVLNINLVSSGTPCSSSSANIPDTVTQMDVYETYEVQHNSVSFYQCSSSQPSDYNIIIPSTNGNYYSGYLQYLYDGGTQGIIVSSVFGEQSNNQQSSSQ
ncbi:hypothetical protein YN1_3840 [Nanoarchaeota archaeon]